MGRGRIRSSRERQRYSERGRPIHHHSSRPTEPIGERRGLVGWSGGCRGAVGRVRRGSWQEWKSERRLPPTKETEKAERRWGCQLPSREDNQRATRKETKESQVAMGTAGSRGWRGGGGVEEGEERRRQPVFGSWLREWVSGHERGRKLGCAGGYCAIDGHHLVSVCTEACTQR